MGGKKRTMTPYGRWLKMTLLNKGKTAMDLSNETGIKFQRISDIVYGVIPGNKYRSIIEDALGEKPPSNLEQSIPDILQ